MSLPKFSKGSPKASQSSPRASPKLSKRSPRPSQSSSRSSQSRPRGPRGLRSVQEPFLGEALQAKWLKVMEGCSKMKVSEFSSGSPGSS